MALLVISFVAGALTVLAPCILPLLPVVIGTAASGRSRFTPYIVVGSLALSVIFFTYALKASAALIMVSPQFWTYLSGGIILFFGLTLVFPALWERIPGVARLAAGSTQLVGAGYQKKNVWGDVLIGAALGPVFSTCSPTYFVILASVLPVSFALGTVYILAYVLGLSSILLAIALLGQKFANRLSTIAGSRSFIKRGIGVLFIVLGVLIATGYEKRLETAILDSGFFDVTKIEQYLLKQANDENNAELNVQPGSVPYVEIVNPSGFVNTDSITVGELVGSKVILIDFLTYSCINCQRTFPYLNAWYRTYKSQGLEIIGIHTPEFAFEKDIANVREAMRKFGIAHPIVLDNDYATWRAYGNSFWPRKYLIDIHGNIVYDHIGEGAYVETEMKIRELLEERAQALTEQNSSISMELISETMPEPLRQVASPEVYFGASRNEYLGNGTPFISGEQVFSLPKTTRTNILYLGGVWNVQEEYAENIGPGTIVFTYQAKDVHMVASAEHPVRVEILQDGVPVATITVTDAGLYTLVENVSADTHTLELRAQDSGLTAFTFTFG